jgi:hypothetical protein
MGCLYLLLGCSPNPPFNDTPSSRKVNPPRGFPQSLVCRARLGPGPMSDPSRTLVRSATVQRPGGVTRPAFARPRNQTTQVRGQDPNGAYYVAGYLVHP